ncbi:MAG TPA: DUF4105 domain-containing protein [Polyangia bacterium]|nr:DUF4105 domain-containing protein [Polyangia bacterium]
MVRRRVLAALVGAVLSAAAGVARAEAPSPTADPLTVHVLTFGPGDHPFFKFGHDAIWIRDAEARTDKVYNFGTFAFSPRVIVDFLHGRMTYWLSVSSLPITLDSYQRENRTIDAQELTLPPAVKRALQARLEVNARPENRAYLYDYFRDNCATRVRDVVDAAVGGALRASAQAPARLTLRQQALRMTADYWPLYVALDIVLGPDTDRPIDRWAEMFIPQELARGLAAVTLETPEGPRPLVKEARTLYPAPGRPPPLETPPARGPRCFAAGAMVGLMFLALGLGASRSRLPRAARVACRVALGIALAVWGLLTGFVGGFLVYAWVFTDHVVAHHNQNILLFAPWAVALLPLGVGVALGGRRSLRAVRAITTAALAAAVAALLLKLGFVRHQENVRLLAFALPAWLGVRAALASFPDAGAGANRPDR